MSDEPLCQSKIIPSQREGGLTRAATCKDDLQVRTENRRTGMRENEHDTTPKESHA
jgi:hypothetical protein